MNNAKKEHGMQNDEFVIEEDDFNKQQYAMADRREYLKQLAYDLLHSEKVHGLRDARALLGLMIIRSHFLRSATGHQSMERIADHPSFLEYARYWVHGGLQALKTGELKQAFCSLTRSDLELLIEMLGLSPPGDPSRMPAGQTYWQFRSQLDEDEG
jgi:hypothetical protein